MFEVFLVKRMLLGILKDRLNYTYPIQNMGDSNTQVKTNNVGTTGPPSCVPLSLSST